MDEVNIKCPVCGTDIPITDALKESIRREMEEEYNRKLRVELEKRVKLEVEKKEEELNENYRTMEEQLEIKSKRLEEAMRKESDERKRRIELEQQLQEQKIEIERRVDEERRKIEETTKRRLEEDFNLKTREMQEKNEELARTVQDLQRKIEQGSQQLQGEALEIELEEFLRNSFPVDLVEPVRVGTKGPDIIHKVRSPAGFEAGSIAWEAKRTKDWKDEWVSKLKDDLVNYRADVGIIVTRTLPKEIGSFGVKDGILVANFESAIPLAQIIRSNLLEVARQKRINQSTDATKEILYKYFTSQQFRQRVESIVSSVRKMKEDLDGERRAMERLWAKRAKDIERAELGISAMFGELQGITGPEIQDIKELELPRDED
ncbi:MAG: DUF2130 domain-containing protein [Thermoplasmatales archaeon]